MDELRVGGVRWGCPAARGAQQQTLLGQKVDQVWRTGGFGELEGGNGLRREERIRTTQTGSTVKMKGTHPGGGAQDGGEGAPLHQLTQSGRGVERAHGHRPRRRRHRRVRVLLPDLLPGSRGSGLQQAGSAVEPRTKSSRLKNEAFGGCGKPERVNSRVPSADPTWTFIYIGSGAGLFWLLLVTACGWVSVLPGQSPARSHCCSVASDWTPWRGDGSAPAAGSSAAGWEQGWVETDRLEEPPRVCPGRRREERKGGERREWRGEEEGKRGEEDPSGANLQSTSYLMPAPLT